MTSKVELNKPFAKRIYRLVPRRRHSFAFFGLITRVSETQIELFIANMVC